MSQFRQLRIIHPLAVDRSVVYTYSFRMKNAPAQMFRDTVAFANVVNGTASWVLTDDLEVYERIQHGLSLGRGGLGVRRPRLRRATSRNRTARCGARPAPARSSSAAQMRAWLDYMTA